MDSGFFSGEGLVSWMSLASTEKVLASFGISMASVGGPPLPPKLEAFKHLNSACGKRKGSPLSQSFVKKTDIPLVDLPPERPCQTALNLAERGLIGQFTGLSPSRC